jgi:beta-glucosidase
MKLKLRIILSSLILLALTGIPNSLADETEYRINTILHQMNLEEKVAQLFMVEIGSIAPKDLEKYKIGAILNGGGSFPYKKKDHTPDDWVNLAEEYFQASITRNDDGPKIPVLWGTDAVHGHNNLKGATLFPHNIGLGATRNAELLKTIGEITAIQVLLTGLDLTFAPALSVPRDDRWGRTYEGFSEHPSLVSELGSSVINGLQGYDESYFNSQHILATAKHFIGDGGTLRGVDKGNTVLDEDELLGIHGEAYKNAIKNGIQVIMASFSSWNGIKMHGHKYLLTDVLKNELGFDGFIVGDYNGHMEVSGCSVISCPDAINAGVDMFMVTDGWKELLNNTIEQVKSNKISTARINDAVRRILRVKLRSGLLDSKNPVARQYASMENLLGSKKHRNIARQAVRESLVLLKNNNKTLPIDASKKILILGEPAENIKYTTGGWSMSWQGSENNNNDFPGAKSILDGLKSITSIAGGEIEYSTDGEFSINPDVAIIVVSEEPYAEYQGTLQSLKFNSKSKHLEWAKTLQEKNISTVTIFLSGRPMWMNREINLSDAFVAAWLPGTEADGIAEVIFQEKPDYDFKGKLSFSWPKDPNQVSLNFGDKNYEPLFPYGYGLNYQSNEYIGPLEENYLISSETDFGSPILQGWPRDPFKVTFGSNSESVEVNEKYKKLSDESVTVQVIDRLVQEDAYRVKFKGSNKVFWKLSSKEKLNWKNEAEEAGVLSLDIKINQRDSNEALDLVSRCGEGCGSKIKIGNELIIGQWVKIGIDLNCMKQNGLNLEKIYDPLIIESAGNWDFEIGEIDLLGGNGGTVMLACSVN